MGGSEDEITRVPTGAGRGGFGNIVEAKKNENKLGSPPPPRHPSAVCFPHSPSYIPPGEPKTD
jgi:hypothetical protein